MDAATPAAFGNLEMHMGICCRFYCIFYCNFFLVRVNLTLPKDIILILMVLNDAKRIWEHEFENGRVDVISFINYTREIESQRRQILAMAEER